MKMSDVSILLMAVLVCGITFAGSEKTSIPTEEQVQKLVDAVWKEPTENIDVTFYKDYTKTPESVEQLRKEIEKMADLRYKGRSKPDEVKRRNEYIEMNLDHRIEKQKFPRKLKNRLRISGSSRRLDLVEVGPKEPLGLDTPFTQTYINTKDADTGNLVSYHYSAEMDTVFVGTRNWAKQTIVQFTNMPITVVIPLKFSLAKDQGSTPASVKNYIPDFNKMTELASTGEVKFGKMVNRISIRPAPNASGTRDIIEVGDPSRFPSCVLVCDREDYSRVYRVESYIPGTDQITYIRECDNFDSNGFPHNVIETEWDRDGDLVEKNVYRIIKVELNPSIPANAFEFQPSESCKVVDNRPKKP